MKKPSYTKYNKKEYDSWTIDVKSADLNSLSLDSLNDGIWLKEWGYNAKVPLAGSWVEDVMKPDVGQNDYHLSEQERKSVHNTWTGAVVHFVPMAVAGYPWVPGYHNFDYTGSGKKSRAAHFPADQVPSGSTGTIISVDMKPNYKGQWMANVLWSDGMLSYENINDLVIVVPGLDSKA